MSFTGKKIEIKKLSKEEIEKAKKSADIVVVTKKEDKE